MAVIITGNNTPTAGGITYGDGSTYANTAAGTSGQPVVSGGAGAPVFRPYTLPASDGSASQVLQTNGSGALSFATPSSGFTLGTPVATTSGTSINFTGIPATAKQIIVSFNEVSTSGTSYVIVQIGDAGGIEITGYQGSGVSILGIVVDQASASAGYLILSANAGHKLSGSITLTMENATAFTWVATGSWGDGIAANASWFTAGRKSLSATLDRVRITTANGTDTFDLGEINIAYI